LDFESPFNIPKNGIIFRSSAAPPPAVKRQLPCTAARASSLYWKTEYHSVFQYNTSNPPQLQETQLGAF
jgi:hypothetical protein